MSALVAGLALASVGCGASKQNAAEPPLSRQQLASLAVASGGTRQPTVAQGWAEANLAPERISLRYPAAWKREYWGCWIGPSMPPLLLLTTARPTPTCEQSHRFPPRELLGRDGVAVWVEDPAPPTNVEKVSHPNTRIDGQPARITPPPLHGLGGSEFVTCKGGAAPGRLLGARIQDPGYSGEGLLLRGGILLVGAVVCGPDYARGDTAVLKVLTSIRLMR